MGIAALNNSPEIKSVNKADRVDDIDWLLSVVRPGFIRKADQKLLIESFGITVEQRCESIRAELHAERDRLILLSKR